ncbi:MAG: hypothetical protein ACREAK_00810 [Nitrosarchaeum sp.]
MKNLNPVLFFFLFLYFLIIIPAYSQEIDIEREIKEKVEKKVLEELEDPIKDAAEKTGKQTIEISCKDDPNSIQCRTTTSSVNLLILVIFLIFLIYGIVEIISIVKQGVSITKSIIEAIMDFIESLRSY